MALFKFLGQRLASLLGWLILLAAVLAAVAVYRIVSFQQTDDSDRMSSKASYLASLAGATGGAKAQRPNIVFILFDDLGYGDIGAGAAGGNLINTPNIDKLAANGVTLSDFHRHGPATLLAGCRHGQEYPMCCFPVAASRIWCSPGY